MGNYYWWVAIWMVVGFAILFTMAKSRGRSPIGWGIFGALFFLIALIVLLIAGPKSQRMA